MEQRVIDEIQKLKSEKNNDFEKQKQQNLISWKYFDWDYSDTPKEGYQAVIINSQTKYAKKIIWNVTDQQYKELLELKSQNKEVEYTDTKLEDFVNFLGWIMLIAAIVLFIVSFVKKESLVLPIIAGELIGSGLLLLIIAKISRNLEKIKTQLKNEKDSK